MFRVPEYYPNVSLKLARVLEDVGVSERIVQNRRQTNLLEEKLLTITNQLKGQNLSNFIFGSQSEGTLTFEMQSDSDLLVCDNRFNVIENMGDWRPGFGHMIMIQDENTAPGYCLLHEVFMNVPWAVDKIEDEHYVKYRDIVVVKNTFINKFQINGAVRNGPAFTSTSRGYLDVDRVFAFPCKTLPMSVKYWLNQQILQGKVTQTMKDYIERNGCFVVAVGKKFSPNEEIEWRISTSPAERCFVFSMNITQIQSYVIMKLILKSYLKHTDLETVSSFMCKNLLLLCIDKIRLDVWQPYNLLKVFTLYLHELQRCIVQESCPHFIIRQNNLMGHHVLHGVKSWLLGRIQEIIETNGRAFLGVKIDDFGLRLGFQMNAFKITNCDQENSDLVPLHVSEYMLMAAARQISDCHKHILQTAHSEESFFYNVIAKLVELRKSGTETGVFASFAPLMYTTFGTMMASRNIQRNRTVSPEAFGWLTLGLQSDVASSYLKLASVLYCAGELDSVESVLKCTRKMYEQNMIEAVCTCLESPNPPIPKLVETEEYENNGTERNINNSVAFCVRFLPSEIHCVPKELQYEMFRYTEEDLKHRDSWRFWMDWAVVDSLPFLHFLIYKTYVRLGKNDEQQRSLDDFIRTVKQSWSLKHDETAWNLLGQCLEQEKRLGEALFCYQLSLQLRPWNNAAKWLLFKLVCSVVYNWSGRI